MYKMKVNLWCTTFYYGIYVENDPDFIAKTLTYTRAVRLHATKFLTVEHCVVERSFV